MINGQELKKKKKKFQMMMNQNNNPNNNDNQENNSNNHYMWNLNSYLTSSTLEVPGTNFEENGNFGNSNNDREVLVIDDREYSNGKKFKCDFEGCGYSANFQSRLNQHKTNHVLDKIIKCDVEGCSFTTKRLDSLRKHKLNHSCERPFKCDFEGCSYSGISTDALNRHKLKHSLERKFKCDFEGCTFAAKRLQNLNKHKLIHIPEKEFKCDFEGCSFATRRMVNLNNHKLKHSTERQFKCHYDGCLFDSKWRCALNRHIKVEHNPQPKLNCDLFADFLIPFHEDTTNEIDSHILDNDNNNNNRNNLIIRTDFVMNDSSDQDEDFFDDNDDDEEDQQNEEHEHENRLNDSSADSSACTKETSAESALVQIECKPELGVVVTSPTKPNQAESDQTTAPTSTTTAPSSQLDFAQTIKMAKHLYGCIDKLRDLNIRIQEVESGLFVARFLWSTLEFRIRFGPPDKALNLFPLTTTDHAETKQIREIIRLDVKSLINPKKKLSQAIMSGHEDQPLYDGDDYDLKFLEEHRSILVMANNYVLLHFGEQRKQLMQKYRNSSELSQLLTDFSELVSSARKLALEIRTIYSSEICKIIPADNSDKFRLSVKLLSINKPIKLHISFDPFKYPDEFIRPTIIIPECDKHLYPLNEFVLALAIIKPGNFNYIRALIRAARCFVKLLMIEMEPNKPRQRKKRRTRAEIMRVAATDEKLKEKENNDNDNNDNDDEDDNNSGRNKRNKPTIEPECKEELGPEEPETTTTIAPVSEADQVEVSVIQSISNNVNNDVCSCKLES